MYLWATTAVLVACQSGEKAARARADSIRIREESTRATAAQARAESLQRVLKGREEATKLAARRAADSVERERTRPSTLELFNTSSMPVRAGDYERAGFEVDSAAVCSVQGRVEVDLARRQGRSDVEVLLLTADQFTNWRAAPSRAVALFDAGPQTVTMVQASVGAAGRYYLVISNRFSTVTGKTVRAQASVVCTGSDPRPL